MVSNHRFWAWWGLLSWRGPTSCVRSPRSCNSGSGPSSRLTVWWDLLWRSSRKPRNQHSTAWRRLQQPRRTSNPELLCSNAWVLLGLLPFRGQCRKAKAAAAASSAGQLWRGSGGGSLDRLCPTVAKFAGDLSGHQHCRGRGGDIFTTSSSAHPSVHQFPGLEQLPGSPAGCECPAVQGSHRESHQRGISRVLQPADPGAEEDRRSSSSHRLVHTEPAHGGAALQDGNPGSVKAAIRSQEWTVSINIRNACLHVPVHRAVRKYLRFVVKKRTYQFTCLPFGLATSPQEFTKLLRPVVAMLRKRGVKLHVYLDDWLNHADAPEQAQPHAQMMISLLQYLGWIINFEKFDLTPSQDFQFIGMQFNTRQFTVVPMSKMSLKVLSVHHHCMTNPVVTARDLHRLMGMVVFMATLVPQGVWTIWTSMSAILKKAVKLNHSLTHWSHREDSVYASASVQSSGGPPQLGARGQGTGLTGLQFLSGCCQRWHGGRLQQSCKVYLSPPGKRKSLSSRMRPARVGGSLDVQQRSDGGVHQRGGGHSILHSHAADVTPAEVVWTQGDKTGSRPSARSPRRPGGFTVQSRPDTEHQVDDGHGVSPTSVCQVGQTTRRLVRDVHQQTPHQVCIALSGPQGGVQGHHVGSLGQREGPPVRVSTVQDGPSSPAKSRSICRCSDDSDRSSAGNRFLVPGNSGPVPRRSHPAAGRRSATAD